VPLEGVVHALERLHTALDRDGLVVDTQPIATRPTVAASGIRLGRLDCREWTDIVAATDSAILQTVERGLYAVVDERRFTVKDTWDNGPECVREVRAWRGTKISDALAKRIADGHPPITVEQLVRLQVLRRLATSPARRRAPIGRK
jgi:hypothetical protein